MKKLSDILKQKPLIVSADTRNLSDIAEERGEPVNETLNRAVKNLKYGDGFNNLWRMIKKSVLVK